MAFDASQFIDAQGNPTDSSLVALAQSIRQQESGGDPTKMGDANTSAGAYQWNNGKTALTPGQVPANFQAGAKAVGLDPNDFSKENQNKVAYLQMAQDKAAGLQPYEIAAKWNSGNKDGWKDHKGTTVINGKTISYDTPQYVKNVMATFTKMRGTPSDNAGPDMSQVPDVPTPTPGQQADNESAQKYGAFLPSNTTDSATMAGVKTASNLIPSAFNFIKGAISAINPINTAKNLMAIPGAFKSVVMDNNGAGLSELPAALYDTIVPEAGRDIVTATKGAITGNQSEIDAGLQGAQRAITNDPFGQIAPFVFGAKGLAEGVDSLTGKAAQANMADYVRNIGENTKNGVPIPTETGTNFGGMVDNAISKTASVVTKPAEYAFGKLKGSVADATPVAEQASEAAGRIVQGTPKDAAVAQKVFQNIDTSGVKTYEDLSKTLDKNIELNKTKVDTAFEGSTQGPVKLKDLTQTVQTEAAGKTVTAKANYVQKAIGDLKELYQKTNDPVELAKMKAIEEKAKTQGLIPKEINDLSRKYGTEFGDKAFSKASGDPLTSVNAQAYENTRTGLKTTARNFLEGDEAKALDKQTSDMIRVKKLVDNMDKKVNALQQRVVKRNVIEKIARGIGQAVDFATFGGPKAFIQKLFFPSNVGLKTLNSLDLEAQLSKNLQTISKLQGVSDDTFAQAIINAMKATNNLPNTKVFKGTVFGRPQISAPTQ